MTRLTIGRITADGGIIHFLDNTKALVDEKDRHISNAWEDGDEVTMLRPRGSMRGFFHLHSSDEVFVDCLWRDSNDEIIV